MTGDPINSESDPRRDYAAGDPYAVRAARPPEPTPAEWDAVLHQVRARLLSARPAAARERGRAVRVVGGLALALAVASVALGLWLELRPVQVVRSDVARLAVPVGAAEGDPLVWFAVLPMAAEEEVELRRVPGAGWLPIGADPVPGVIALATEDEVELDDPDPAWSKVTPSPGDAPMVYAAKPR
ncbi:MAG: hypothetical protein ACKODX_23735 [Gemmata sp.]